MVTAEPGVLVNTQFLQGSQVYSYEISPEQQIDFLIFK